MKFAILQITLKYKKKANLINRGISIFAKSNISNSNFDFNFDKISYKINKETFNL